MKCGSVRRRRVEDGAPLECGRSPHVSTRRSSAGSLGQGYETLIASSGGKGPTPFVFKMVAGALPPGLTLPPDYAIGEHGTIIGGTPSAKGTFTFTIQVTDGAGDTATGPFSLTVA
jgi:large repetitive protein